MICRLDGSIAHGTWGVAILVLFASVPAQTQETRAPGAVRALPGLCQARGTADGPWRNLVVGGEIVAGDVIVCQHEGRLTYAVPGSGIEVARQVQAGEEVVVARGRVTPTPIEGTRPGLRAAASPPSGVPEVTNLAALPTPMGPVPTTGRTAVAGALLGAAVGKSGRSRLLGAAGGWPAWSPELLTRYLADLRTTNDGDENRVVAHVADDVRLDNSRIALLHQTFDQWLFDRRLTPTIRPGEVDSPPADDERRQRDKLVLSAMSDRLEAAKRVSERYEDVASRLQVKPEARAALDRELGVMRVGTRQLELRLHILQSVRHADQGASAPP